MRRLLAVLSAWGSLGGRLDVSFIAGGILEVCGQRRWRQRWRAADLGGGCRMETDRRTAGRTHPGQAACRAGVLGPAGVGAAGGPGPSQEPPAAPHILVPALQERHDGK